MQIFKKITYNITEDDKKNDLKYEYTFLFYLINYQ